MRFYDITIFMICINVALSIMNVLDPYNIGGNTAVDINGQTADAYMQSSMTGLNDTVTTVAGTATTSSPLGGFFNQVFQFTFVMIPRFINTLLQLAVPVYFIMIKVGVPVVVAAPIGVIVTAIQVFGIAQWISGRSVRDAE